MAKNRKNGKKSQKMVKNRKKWSKMLQNAKKSQKMVKNCQKCSENAKNAPKMPKMLRKCQKCSENAKNAQNTYTLIILQSVRMQRLIQIKKTEHFAK